MTARKSETEATEAAPEASYEPVIGNEFAAILADVDRDIVSVRPNKEGWTIAGKVVANETITTEFGERPATVLDTNPSEPTLPLVRFVWISTVLQNQYERHQPRRGDYVAARFVRKSTGKGVGDYDDWRVMVQRPIPADGPPARSRRVENREEPF